jgi:hypothetical protein
MSRRVFVCVSPYMAVPTLIGHCLPRPVFVKCELDEELNDRPASARKRASATHTIRTRLHVVPPKVSHIDTVHGMAPPR